MTFEDLIKEANARGLYLNNLFQLRDMQWQANFRVFASPTEQLQTSKAWPWGVGSTPQEALRKALDHPDTRAATPLQSSTSVTPGPVKNRITIIKRK